MGTHNRDRFVIDSMKTLEKFFMTTFIASLIAMSVLAAVTQTSTAQTKKISIQDIVRRSDQMTAHPSHRLQ